MTYSETIKKGFGLIHRQWQLIVVQFVLALAGCLGFFFIVGIPLVATVAALGLDVNEISKLKDFLLNVDDPFELIRKYLGIGLVLLSALMLYILFAFSIWIFAIGGSAAMIGASLRDPLHKFSLKGFMAEGKRLFFPLTAYTGLVGAVLIAAVLALGIAGGGIAAIMAFLRLKETLFGVVFALFFAFPIILLGAGATFLAMAFTLYGTAMMTLDKTGVMETVKKTYGYLKAMPSALALYAAVLLGYAVIYGMAFIVSILLGLIPFVGQILLIPYQLFIYLLQGYMNIVMLAIVIAYYFFNSPHGSIPKESTSSQEAQGQEPPQEETPPPASA